MRPSHTNDDDRVNPQVSNIKHEDLKLCPDDMTKIISDVQHMKGKQESMDIKISTLKQ